MSKKISKKTIQTNETRQKILESASEVFIENGFNETTIKLISERAGIAYSTSYVYFENKSEIFSFVIDETMKHLYSMARREFFPNSVAEAYKIIIDQSRMHLETSISHYKMMKVIKEAINSSELIKNKWSNVQEYFIGTISQDITYSQNNGLLRKDVMPNIAAKSWYSVNEWFLWEILNNPENYQIDKLVKQIVLNYVYGIILLMMILILFK